MVRPPSQRVENVKLRRMKRPSRRKRPVAEDEASLASSFDSQCSFVSPKYHSLDCISESAYHIRLYPLLDRRG